MFSTHDFLWAILIPAVITAGISVLGWRPWHGGGLTGRWVAPLALGVAFILAFPGMNGEEWSWPLISPRESTAWLPWIAAVGILAGLAAALLWQPRWMVTIFVFLLSLIACWMLTRFKFVNREWSAGWGILLLLGFALSGTLWWAVMEQAVEEWPMQGALMMGISSACVAVVLMLTGSLTYGKFALTVGFALAGFLPALLWRRDLHLHGLAATFSVILVPMLLGGFYLSKLPLALLLLLSATPMFAAAGILIPRRVINWRRVMFRITLCAAPLLVAVAIAAVQFQKASKARQSDENSFYDQ